MTQLDNIRIAMPRIYFVEQPTEINILGKTIIIDGGLILGGFASAEVEELRLYNVYSLQQPTEQDFPNLKRLIINYDNNYDDNDNDNEKPTDVSMRNRIIKPFGANITVLSAYYEPGHYTPINLSRFDSIQRLSLRNVELEQLCSTNGIETLCVTESFFRIPAADRYTRSLFPNLEIESISRMHMEIMPGVATYHHDDDETDETAQLFHVTENDFIPMIVPTSPPSLESRARINRHTRSSRNPRH